MSYAAAAMGGGGDGMKKEVDAVDWLNLPCPVKYEEIQRENISKWNEVLFPPCHLQSVCEEEEDDRILIKMTFDACTEPAEVGCRC